MPRFGSVLSGLACPRELRTVRRGTRAGTKHRKSPCYVMQLLAHGEQISRRDSDIDRADQEHIVLPRSSAMNIALAPAHAGDEIAKFHSVPSRSIQKVLEIEY